MRTSVRDIYLDELANTASMRPWGEGKGEGSSALPLQRLSVLRVTGELRGRAVAVTSARWWGEGIPWMAATGLCATRSAGELHSASDKVMLS